MNYVAGALMFIALAAALMWSGCHDRAYIAHLGLAHGEVDHYVMRARQWRIIGTAAAVGFVACLAIAHV